MIPGMVKSKEMGLEKPGARLRFRPCGCLSFGRDTARPYQGLSAGAAGGLWRAPPEGARQQTSNWAGMDDQKNVSPLRFFVTALVFWLIPKDGAFQRMPNV